MDYYTLIAAIVYGVFFAQFILSWFGGDADMDLDFDGNVDMNIGDFISFKGLIHFLMGSTGWLYVRDSVSGNVQWYDYLIALFTGIIFVVILYFIYKLCMKLQCIPKRESKDAIVGRTGKVYLKLDDQHYIITIQVNGQEDTIDVKGDSDYKTGDYVKVVSYVDGEYFIH